MKRLIFLVAAGLLLAGCAKNDTANAKDGKGGKKGNGPIPVRSARVETRQIRREIQSVGTFFPYDEVVVSAEIDGKAEKINADLGDTVNQGQVLVQISDEEQRYLLQQNEAQLRQALERLGLVNENDKVKDILQTPEVRKAKADLTDAEQRFQRQRSLTEQGIGAKSDLDAAVGRVTSTQAAYESTVNQTRNSVQEVERTRAVVDLQRKKLRDTNVIAPFTGQIKDRQVTQGQFLKANTPLFTIVKLNPLRLRLEIPERMGPWTKIGQKVDLEVEAYPGRKFVGKVWRVAPTVDQGKRTFIAEALVDNPRSELKPGSYAKATIATEKVDAVTVVPESAVAYILGLNKSFVIENGEVEAREVKLGDRIDGTVEILEGLKPGEEVAASQTQRLDSGVAVRVVTGAEADAPGGRRGGDPSAPPADGTSGPGEGKGKHKGGKGGGAKVSKDSSGA